MCRWRRTGRGRGAGAVVLVEGMSDQSALATLAVRRGRDLAGQGVFIVPMGGATNIGHFLAVFGPQGFGVRLAGLCDQGQEQDVRRALGRAGLRPGPTRADLERLGFFVCVAEANIGGTPSQRSTSPASTPLARSPKRPRRRPTPSASRRRDTPAPREAQACRGSQFRGRSRFREDFYP